MVDTDSNDVSLDGSMRMLFQRFVARLDQAKVVVDRINPAMTDRQLRRALEDVEVLLDTAHRDLSMDTIDLLREHYTSMSPDSTDAFVEQMVQEFIHKRGRSRLPKASKVRTVLMTNGHTMGAVPRTR